MSMLFIVLFHQRAVRSRIEYIQYPNVWVFVDTSPLCRFCPGWCLVLFIQDSSLVRLGHMHSNSKPSIEMSYKSMTGEV